jgi:hypothetical protein
LWWAVGGAEFGRSSVALCGAETIIVCDVVMGDRIFERWMLEFGERSFVDGA